MPLIRPISALTIIASLFFALQGSAAEPVAEKASVKELKFAESSPWKPCHFGGDGPIEMKDGVLSLGFGDPLTGVRWEGDFPKKDYEISLEARRTGGFDFFCGLTLPIGDQRFSLILGGWGGSLVGLSSIDGLDASSNETMMIRDFTKDQWYKVRVRVTGTDHVKVWLDGDEIIDLDRNGRVMDVRSEMEESTPMGIAAFQCESQVRDVRVRLIADEPKPAANQTKAASPQ
ncbi:MAG: 3-keto-disaccharide hydrolase [Planctomycetaceae bacterium]